MTAIASTTRSRLPLVPRLPLIIDLLVAAGTLGFALVNDYFGDQVTDRLVAYEFDIALCIPLLWRRRQPLYAFGAVAALALVEWLSDTPAAGAAAVLVALYAVGAYESRRWAVVLATATASVGVIMATLRWAPADHRLGVLLLLAGTVTAAWVMGIYAQTRRAYVDSVLDRAATAEREVDQQALLATAAERARISREMHDIVAHTLSVMVALSDGAAMSVSRDATAAREAMEQSSILGRQSLADLRRLLGGLNEPNEGDRSPTPGLDQLPELVTAVRAAGLTVRLAMAGAPQAMPPAVQLAVYRLVQESLTNVLKHAPGATQANVILTFAPSTVDIAVTNDGVGATVNASHHPGGHGIAGMAQRAAVFAGALEAGPLPDGGWRVATRLHFADDQGPG